MYAAHLSVAKVRDVESFLEARTRLQRLSDRRFFNGWLSSLSHSHAVVRMNSGHAGGGDVFSVEVSGIEQTALFLGSVTKSEDDRIFLNVVSEVNFLPCKEAARFRKSGYKGLIKAEGAEAPFTMTDLSDEGIGLLSPLSISNGVQVEFEVATPSGKVEGFGEVRNCKRQEGLHEMYRIGIRFTPLDRIERARWRNFRAS